MSFLDDMGKFGSGLLDDVGEGMGNLIKTGTSTTKKQQEASTNSGVTQQPQVQVKDNHGNAVTGTPQPKPKDSTLLYIGGALGVAVVLIGLVIAIKR